MVQKPVNNRQKLDKDPHMPNVDPPELRRRNAGEYESIDHYCQVQAQEEAQEKAQKEAQEEAQAKAQEEAQEEAQAKAQEEDTTIDNAHDKLQNIAALISKGECTSIRHMKSLIRELTIVVNGLTNGEKIAFIKMLNICFKSYYSTFPEAMELYFTQIITIIDANLSLSIDFSDIEFMQLIELSNNTMRMIVTEFDKEPVLPDSNMSRNE